MLDLEDIEILPESMPPAVTESAPTWMIVVAVAIVLAIAALIVRALVTSSKEGTGKTNPLDVARDEFLRISNSLSKPGIEESFPTLIHAWANDQLAHRAELPSKVVDEMTSARDLVAPHCYQPASRWHNEIDPDSILSSLASSLEIDVLNSQKGGQTSDA